MDSNTQNAPRWTLDSVYRSFDCAEYKRDCELLKRRIADFEALLAALPQDLTAEYLVKSIEAWEAAGDYAENLASYAEAVYTTDTQNQRARAEINNIEAAKLPLGKDTVIFRGALAARRERVAELARTDGGLQPYAFFLHEAIEKSSYQMSGELEDLANDLCRSGGGAWARLHDALSSTAGAVFDGGERKTVTELRALANNGDRDLRRRAYLAELEAWKAVEIPMAAALNGVKGHAITVDKRRGWKSQIQKSVFQSRISEKTLSALISAVESSLP
ncbi:MAG: peptidase M3, partial [Spirochaetaceae bacterium]|nr:peptidase M3 [Spirochaetaceae bacterium]